MRHVVAKAAVIILVCLAFAGTAWADDPQPADPDEPYAVVCIAPSVAEVSSPDWMASQLRGRSRVGPVLRYLEDTWEALVSPVGLHLPDGSSRQDDEDQVVPDLVTFEDGLWPIRSAGRRLTELVVVCAAHGLPGRQVENLVLHDRTTESFPMRPVEAVAAVPIEATATHMEMIEIVPQGGAGEVSFFLLRPVPVSSGRR